MEVKRENHPLVSRTTLGIAVSAAVVGAFFTVFPAYFPNDAEARGFSSGIIGLTLMTAFVLNVLASTQTNRVIKHVGRKNTAILGILLNVGTGGLLVLSTSMNSSSLFLTFAILARALQGVGLAFVEVSHFALFNAVYPNKVSLLASVYELFKSAGFIVGPLIGGELSQHNGYAALYGAFTCFALFASFIVQLTYDKSVTDISTEVLFKRSMSISVNTLNDINSYKNLFSKKRVLLAALASMITQGHFVLVDPVITLYWRNEFGLSEKGAGQLYSYPYLGFMLGNILNPVLYKRLSHRAWLSVGIFIEAASVLVLFGPSYLLNMPNRIDLMIVGLTLARLANSYTFIAGNCEMLEGATAAFSMRNMPPEMGDRVSSIFGFSTGFGSIVYPMAMSFLVEELDYRLCTDIFGALGVFYIFVYTILVYDKKMFRL